MTGPDIRPPDVRTCERCGRRDRWDAAVGRWSIDDAGGEHRAGDPYCIHEWDVTGDYNPVPE